MPIIISTNDWSSEAVDIDDNLREWIAQNSVHYPVTDYLYDNAGESS